MCSLFVRPLTTAALLTIGVTATALTPLIISVPVLAQETPVETEQAPTQAPTQAPAQAPATTPTTVTFPDVSPNFWAYPFIQGLAARNIITGFPDGTFRPEQAVTRAQFAAMIQQAFNQNRVRQLPPNGFTDVPAGFWGSAAIQEAYETGFMSGYPDNTFLPNQQIPKVQAIVALSSGLGLTPTGAVANVLQTNYTDFSAIPNYASNAIAAATESGVVVNYPNVQVLNPLVPLTRADAAAHIYQALVRLGQLPPLPSNVAAANYIVGGPTVGAQPTQNDIVSLAASSDNFTVLTSLLKTAGLAEVLQQPGQYTVFAPTDAAFAALPEETLQNLQKPENKETLIQVLRYHVVPRQITANELSAGELQTLQERPVNIQIDTAQNRVAVNNATIQGLVQASNGIIYAVDQVLVPPDVTLQTTPDDTGIEPGRATRGGRSYIGVAGNIGLSGDGDSGVGDTNFAVISKLGITNTISIRPSGIFGDNFSVLVPVTFDFSPSAAPVAGDTFTISPYIGAGAAITTDDDADVNFLLTGGVDVPLFNRFTATGAVNAVFGDGTDVGLLLGVGFNF